MNKVSNVTKGYTLGVLANILFGFSFYFTKTVLNLVDNKVFTVLSLRFTIGLITVILLYKFKFISLNFKGKDIKSLLILCMFQPFLYFMLETFGVKYTSTSEVGVMISMIPVVTGIMGIIFLNEKMNLKQVACIIIAVFGVIIVNLQNTGNQTSSMLGRLMILGAVICAGAYGVYVRKLSKSEFTPIEITAAMQLIGTVSFISISVGGELISGNLIEYAKELFNMEIVFPIIYLGMGCSLLAMFLNNYSRSKLEAVKSSILSNIATVVSIFAGVFLLNEKFNLYSVIGSVLIIISIIGMVIYGKEKYEDLETEYTN